MRINSNEVIEKYLKQYTDFKKVTADEILNYTPKTYAFSEKYGGDLVIILDEKSMFCFNYDCSVTYVKKSKFGRDFLIHPTKLFQVLKCCINGYITPEDFIKNRRDMNMLRKVKLKARDIDNLHSLHLFQLTEDGTNHVKIATNSLNEVDSYYLMHKGKYTLRFHIGSYRYHIEYEEIHKNLEKYRHSIDKYLHIHNSPILMSDGVEN